VPVFGLQADRLDRHHISNVITMISSPTMPEILSAIRNAGRMGRAQSNSHIGRSRRGFAVLYADWRTWMISVRDAIANDTLRCTTGA